MHHKCVLAKSKVIILPAIHSAYALLLSLLTACLFGATEPLGAMWVSVTWAEACPAMAWLEAAVSLVPSP